MCGQRQITQSVASASYRRFGADAFRLHGIPAILTDTPGLKKKEMRVCGEIVIDCELHKRKEKKKLKEIGSKDASWQKKVESVQKYFLLQCSFGCSVSIHTNLASFLLWI